MLRPGAARTLVIRFALDPAANRAITAAGGWADLGIVPFSETPARRPARLGVIRFTLR
jgi:hypothetical protein